MTAPSRPENEDGKLTIQFIANPTQRLFIESQAKADLFACRMGEGKSAALVWACYHHTRENPGAKWMFIRDTWVNLQATTQQEFFYWFPPGVMGEYHKGEKKFTWFEGVNRGEVTFLGLDDEKDAHKLQSRQAAGFAFDEPAPASDSGGIDEMIFDIALTRLRQPGMNWYACKLAENNPDETHWTYTRFVEPGNPNFKLFKTAQPENLTNLPHNYYQDMTKNLAHRPDLVRRFALGEFGFQQIGLAVTPEWSNHLHLTEGLEPIPGLPLHICWDFGLNPTCIITQITPLGHWHVLEAHVGEGIGVYELIEDTIKARLTERYSGYDWDHTGDPMGKQREQSSSRTSAVKVIKKELGGAWHDGPVALSERIDPLRAVLRKTTGVGGLGVVRVDKTWARPIWLALRGGWHRKRLSGGTVSREPIKDVHSHPADALSYGAARFFPLGALKSKRMKTSISPAPSRYFGGKTGPLGFERPGLQIPEEARVIGES